MKPVVVVDASVAVKWFVPLSRGEEDGEAALAILKAYSDDRIELLQPPIWRAEVLAVLARVLPESVEQHAWKLLAFDHIVASGSAVYLKSVNLALLLRHHLFDTIYHAAALTHPAASLITADDRYRAKAESLGRVLPLHRWQEIFIDADLGIPGSQET